MKLSECKYGVLVTRKDNRDYLSKSLGMVVGISENSCKEAIPLIQWQDGSKSGVHPSNLKIYEDQIMNLTKELIIEVIARIDNILNDVNPLYNKHLGICANLTFKTSKGHELTLDRSNLLGYDLVEEFSPSWSHFNGNDVYPINDDPSIGKWEGKNLELRLDLLKHIRNQLTLELEALK